MRWRKSGANQWTSLSFISTEYQYYFIILHLLHRFSIKLRLMVGYPLLQAEKSSLKLEIIAPEFIQIWVNYEKIMFSKRNSNNENKT